MSTTKTTRSGKKRGRRQDTLDSFLIKAPRTRISSEQTTVTAESTQAERLADRLWTRSVYYLTPDHKSWYLYAKGWMPSTETQFAEEWSLHPTSRLPLKLFGKVVYEKRWSQAWGVSYSYSGGTNIARSLEESTMVPLLLQRVNALTEDIFYEKEASINPYNGCLQNWYEPEDVIGLHADDEKDLRREFPIFSLSWGGTRRFLLRSRESKTKTEIWLEDGDLLVMGGTCQVTHQHEVPKRRVTIDPPTSDRINWTLRAFHSTGRAE